MPNLPQDVAPVNSINSTNGITNTARRGPKAAIPDQLWVELTGTSPLEKQSAIRGLVAKGILRVKGAGDSTEYELINLNKLRRILRNQFLKRR